MNALALYFIANLLAISPIKDNGISHFIMLNICDNAKAPIYRMWTLIHIGSPRNS